MSSTGIHDSVVIGSGPNGLAAAVRLAQAGRSVLVLEGHQEPGGGTRTAELTLRGFHHDVCSAIHPMGLASPFLGGLPLNRFGLEWVQPEIPLAHPFDDRPAALMKRSVEETASAFSRGSAAAYRKVFSPLVKNADSLMRDLLAPASIPTSPLPFLRFGLCALPAALDAARLWFDDESARALLAGNAAHSVLPLDRPLSTNAIGIMLMLVGHAYGWPVAKGGTASIHRALIAYLESLGGTVQTGIYIQNWSDLPPANHYIFDTSPSAVARIAADQLPASYTKRLLRFRHGPGVFKIDYALDGPVPWKDESCSGAGTVHLGGNLDEITLAERETWQGRHPLRPFVLTAQQSVSDPTRAPVGKHTFWAYCHVPSGSEVDMTDSIENQIERFAPGFRDRVLARNTMNCSDYERYNPNFIGGDIVGGIADWRQLLTRPVARLRPHTTPNPRIFVCSASTPPGGGVHGMGGYWAAEEVLRGT